MLWDLFLCCGNSFLICLFCFCVAILLCCGFCFRDVKCFGVLSLRATVVMSASPNAARVFVATSKRRTCIIFNQRTSQNLLNCFLHNSTLFD